MTAPASAPAPAAAPLPRHHRRRRARRPTGHPSYGGACLIANSSDYDCAGGSGNGPDYTGTVWVVGPDDYYLDADGDGYACE